MAIVRNDKVRYGYKETRRSRKTFFNVIRLAVVANKKPSVITFV